MRKFKTLSLRAPVRARRLFDLTPIAGVFDSVLTNVMNAKAVKDTNKQNYKIADETNRLSYKMMKEQNDFNRKMALEMFNLENAYNTPQQQVARLRAAGLNPAVAMDNGGVSASMANASAPTSSGIPNLVTPTMQAPSFHSNIADSILKLAQAKKTNKESSRFDEVTDAQIASVMADISFTEAKDAAQRLNNELDSLFSRAERKRGLDKLVMNLKKTNAEFVLAVQQGKTEEAKQKYYEADTLLKKSQDAAINEQRPVLLDNLRKVGQKTLEEANAAKAAANASNAAANASNAQANVSNETAKTIKARRDNIVELDYQLAQEKAINNQQAIDSYGDKLRLIANQVNLTQTQKDYFDQQISKAIKENNIYYIREAVNVLRQISDGVSNWIPMKGLGSSSTSPMPSNSSSTAPEWSFLYGN